MRISELDTNEGLDVLCEITPYIGAIATDKDLRTELVNKANVSENATEAEIWTAALGKLSKLMPIILKTHRADVYAIIGALNGKTPQEIEKQLFIKTAVEIRDIVNDKEFLDFFKSLWNTEQK
jgi:hypothetical protein